MKLFWSKVLIMLIAFVFVFSILHAQQLILKDYNNGDKQVNDSVITVFTSDLTTMELSAHLRIYNNTSKPLAIFMKKIINQLVDSTSNYFCLNPRCWPDADSTDIADTIPAGVGDSSFVTHYDHFFRNEKPVPPGFSSITYLFYDHTSFPLPVEARVTINYHISGVGIPEAEYHQVNVFPVPTSGMLKFTFNSVSDQLTGISLFDLQGRLILQSPGGIKGNEYNLDLRSCKNGIYQAVCRTISGRLETKRVVVQH